MLYSDCQFWFFVSCTFTFLTISSPCSYPLDNFPLKNPLALCANLILFQKELPCGSCPNSYFSRLGIVREKVSWGDWPIRVFSFFFGSPFLTWRAYSVKWLITIPALLFRCPTSTVTKSSILPAASREHAPCLLCGTDGQLRCTPVPDGSTSSVSAFFDGECGLLTRCLRVKYSSLKFPYLSGQSLRKCVPICFAVITFIIAFKGFFAW